MFDFKYIIAQRIPRTHEFLYKYNEISKALLRATWGSNVKFRH